MTFARLRQRQGDPTPIEFSAKLFKIGKSGKKTRVPVNLMKTPLLHPTFPQNLNVFLHSRLARSRLLHAIDFGVQKRPHWKRQQFKVFFSFNHLRSYMRSQSLTRKPIFRHWGHLWCSLVRLAAWSILCIFNLVRPPE